MDYDDNDEDYLPPHSAYIYRSPKEPNLRAEYDLYKTSISVRRLFSEWNRQVFAGTYIENHRIGPLISLCIEAVAKLGLINNIPALVRNDPLKLRLYYDSLDVDLPLKQCFKVDDILYWRRVVLSKSSNQLLKLIKWNDYDWKSKGVSLKYTELVENCPAEFWPEKEMAELGALVKGNVKSMHIRRLMPLPETAFTHYVESESEVDVTSSSSEIEVISSDEPDTEEEKGDEEETVENNSENKGSSGESSPSNHNTFFYGSVDLVNERATDFSPMDTDRHNIDRRNARHDRNAARQQLRNIQATRQAQKEKRHQRRESIRKMLQASMTKTIEKKRKKIGKKIKGVFDMAVEPEPSDDEDKIIDTRNKERLLRRKTRFDYPAIYCHHIDLSFVRYFDNLVSFHLEFLGPPSSVHDYHNRYLKISFNDITHLGKGLKTLEQLKIFRLRNSRLDRNQMQVLARALKSLNMLEEVDFGYDQLADNCCVAFKILLEREKMIKVLQLEYNKLGKSSMEAIIFALSQYNGIETLDYLGLAHNPITGLGLSSLCHYLIESNHVERLNISGIEVSKEIVANEVSRLLRYHDRLRHLDMAAIPLDPLFGSLILRALKSNNNILYIDCRYSDLGPDAEFEIDILLRRNTFLLNNKYVGSTPTSEKEICKYILDTKHPIVAKIEQEQKEKSDCRRNLLYLQSSPESSIPGTIESKKNSEIYDSWTMFGTKTQLQRFSKVKIENNLSVESLDNRPPFIYNPNLFNMEEFREYVYQPGPSNRYFYFKNKKGL